MSDKNQTDDNIEIDPEAHDEPLAEVPHHDEPTPTTEAMEAEEALVSELQSERDEMFNRLQRVSADYQNYIKRSQQQLVDQINLERGNTLRSFIPVIDVIDQALANEPEEEAAKAIFEGVRIIRDELLKVFEQVGVERLNPQVGDPFDPHLHEALLQQHAEDLEPNQISLSLGCGYVYKGRTLRPAKVAVVPE